MCLAPQTRSWSSTYTSGQISNEFKFEVAAFHHAHEAYLVPNVLKRAYGMLSFKCGSVIISSHPFSFPGRPPALAMFSSFSRYKREAYRHSEYAPRILADAGLDVIMKVCARAAFI